MDAVFVIEGYDDLRDEVERNRLASGCFSIRPAPGLRSTSLAAARVSMTRLCRPVTHEDDFAIPQLRTGGGGRPNHFVNPATRDS
jgi:hypothetical protein